MAVNKHSIRVRFVRSYILLASALMLIIAFSFFMFLRYSRDVQRLVQRYEQHDGYYLSLNEAHSALESCLLNPTPENIERSEQADENFLAAASSLNSVFLDRDIENFYYMALSYQQAAASVRRARLETSLAGASAAWDDASAIRDAIAASDSLFSQIVQRERNALSFSLRMQMIFHNVSVSVLLASALLVCFLVLRRYLNRLLEPLNRLAAEAQSFLSGEFAPPASCNEVELLSVSFHQMLDTINRQIEDVKAKNELEKRLKDQEILRMQTQAQVDRLQMKVLQSRVNPHFLFNTINMVISTALDESAFQTTQALEILAHYLRYSLSSLDQIVTLEQELENLQDYIAIQKLRFADRIAYDQQVDEDCRSACVPAMIIQPLVENALIHGLCNLPNESRVSIRITRKAGDVLLCVEDNGEGMTAERIAEVLAHAREESMDVHGIGLYNVYHRMRICFGGKISLNIESVPGVSTAVALRFPCERRMRA